MASNWFVNFLISFFTAFITERIGYLYGLVFAGCLFALVWIVYLFLIESKDRSLEEIDTMYLEGVKPRESAAWKPRLYGGPAASGVVLGDSVMEVSA